MLGVLVWHEERNVVLERTDLLGMPVLRVSVSPDGRWAARRLGRAGRLLARQRVRRVLVPDGFDSWRELDRWGLCPVDPLPLYRAMADRMVLAELARSGVENERACVALRGDYVDADLERTARLLCPKVRTLIIQAAWGGERLTLELYRTFGAAPRREVPPDAAVRFSGAGQPEELVLCGRPNLLGLEPEAAGAALPEGAEPIPLLTALWQAGRLSLEEIRLNDANFLDMR